MSLVQSFFLNRQVSTLEVIRSKLFNFVSCGEKLGLIIVLIAKSL